MKYTVSIEHDGKMLREYLSCVLLLSRAELTRLKKRDDGIVLNGKRVTVRALLKAGDVIELNRADDEASGGITPIEMPIEILYEDDDIVALNKGPSTPTHPSHEHQSDTLANGLCHYYKEKGVPFVFRAVNRLDRDTSGIVLVAKNMNSAYRLSNEIASFNVTKQYIAIVEGELTDGGVIRSGIVREEESKIKRIVCETSVGQYAETEYRVLLNNNGYSVLLVTPKTGRTHQIRVHMASIGHPILGDTLYGDEKGCGLISRQALHAYSLEFTHPTANERIKITAPLHEDMQALLDVELQELI